MAVSAGSCAGGYVLVRELEKPLLFSSTEVLVLGPGVMLGFNVSTAVNFHLRGNAVLAGFAAAASPLVVGPGTTPLVLVTASAATIDRRHASPVPGNGSIIRRSYGTGVGQVYVLDFVERKESLGID